MWFKYFILLQLYGKIYVECLKDEESNWYICAGFDENSRLIYYGDLPDEMCKKIEEFLESQCIYIDENGIAYCLIN